MVSNTLIGSPVEEFAPDRHVLGFWVVLSLTLILSVSYAGISAPQVSDVMSVLNGVPTRSLPPITTSVAYGAKETPKPNGSI